MQMITALIQPFRLEQVISELLEAGIIGMTVCACCGHGRQFQLVDSLCDDTKIPRLLDKVKIEVAGSDCDMKVAIRAIVRGARLDKVGDGKIFVTTLERVVSIRTRSEGDVALHASFGVLEAAE